MDPKAVVIGSALAERYGLALGSPLRLRVQDRIETLEVAGIAHAATAEEAAVLETVVLMDVGAAQRLFRLGDRVSRIDLIATDADLARIAPLLPEGTRVAPASEQASTVGQLTDAFQLNLTALSLLALVVGMFLIYNTVMFGVVQRRAVIGTLRLLGATGGQVFALVLLETAAASAVGTLLGLGLGWLLGQGAVRLVTQTINDLYYVVSVTGAPLTAFTVVKAVALGLGAGVLSAVAPALEAARVEPVEALRRSSFEDRARRLLPRVGAAGAVLAALGRTAAPRLGPLAPRELRRPLRDRPRPRPAGPPRHRRRDVPGDADRRPPRRHARPSRHANRHSFRQPHRRRGGGAGGGRLGHDRRRPDDRELPLDRRELARPHAAGRRLHRRAVRRRGARASRRSPRTCRRRWPRSRASRGSRPSARCAWRARSAR